MSLSSISWHIGRLVGSSSPALPITPSPKEWLALVARTVGMPCRSEPQQGCVPARSPPRGPPPTSTPAAGPEQLQPLQVIGGELDSTEIVGDGLRAACVSCHGLGGAHGRVFLVVTLSRRDDDPMPTTGRSSRWTGTGSCLSRHGNEPGRPRRLGFHGTLSARSYSASGDGSSPNEDDFAPTASGPDLTAEGYGDPHPGRRTVAPGWTAWFGQQARQELDGH
jgi:hypothetical protein